MADPRERRDELLLDLGALVFELHRQDRRAPELLRAKAAELDALDRGQPAEEAEAECPRCGAAAHAEQLVCLECGGRITLDPHPLEVAAWAAAERVEAEREGAASSANGAPPSGANVEPPAHEAPALAVWNAVPEDHPPPVAVPMPRQPWWPRALGGIAVAVGVAAATLLILLAIDGSGTDAPSREARLGTTPPPARPRAVDTPARPVRQRQHAGGVPAWRDGNAYTVILLTTGDAGSARRAAERLGGQGVRAGVVRNRGFWLVFSGRYEDQSAASAAATRLRGKLGAAYVQFIER
jgi:ribosomal protein S27AE